VRPGLLALLLAMYAAFGVLLAIALMGVVLPWIGGASGLRAPREALGTSAGSAFFAFAMALALVALDRVRRRRGIVFRHPRPVQHPIDIA